MMNSQPTGIQFHLITGRKQMFYQEDAELVARICGDLEGHIFGRANLILNGEDDVTAIPGSAMIGITILTHPLPDSFHERERLTQIVITQISQESFQFKRLRDLAKVKVGRSPILSEIEFVSGERLFLEFNEVAAGGVEERNVLQQLFARPYLSCRHLDGGFSVWNTAHIVSWSHYPKLGASPSSWQIVRVPESLPESARHEVSL